MKRKVAGVGFGILAGLFLLLMAKETLVLLGDIRLWIPRPDGKMYLGDLIFTHAYIATLWGTASAGCMLAGEYFGSTPAQREARKLERLRQRSKSLVHERPAKIPEYRRKAV